MIKIKSLKKLICFLLVSALIFTLFTGCGDEDVTSVDNTHLDTVGQENWDTSNDEKVENRAKTLRGFTLSAGVDYDVSKQFDIICNEIVSIFDNAKDSFFNTVYIDVLFNNKALFKTNVIEYFSDIEQDLVDFIYNAALERGFYIYFTFDINQLYPVNPANPNTDFINLVGNLVNKYTYLSGVMYSNYTPTFDESVYTDYLLKGSLTGVENHKYKITAKYIENIISATKRFSSNIFVGVLYEVNATKNITQLSFDDYCNIPKWLENSITDYAAIKYSPSEQNVNFFKLWEPTYKNAQKYLYINANDEVFYDSYVKAHDYYFDGLIVNNIKKLISNKDLWNKIKDYDNKIFGGVSENLRNTILTIHYPTEETITTDEKYYYIKGASDPLHPVLINNNKVTTDNLGNFSYKVSLNDGDNKFTITHKEFTKVYNIKHKFNIFRSVSPTNTLTVSGASKLKVSAICVKGASVKATLNGQSVNLTQNTSDSESAYATYSGSFVIPAETTSVQNLGKITFTATFNGATGSRSGSTVYVNKSSNIPPKIDDEFNITNESGKVGYILRINHEQAETFNGDTGDNRSRCINAYLPRGTVDYCGNSDIKLNEADATYYYRYMNYGKRVYSRTESYRGIKTDYISIYYGSLPDHNTISTASIDNDGRHTYITLNSEWKAPFNVTLAPQTYIGTTKLPAEYMVDSTTYEYIDFSFSYCNAASGSIDLTNDPVFSKSEWILGSNGEYTLRLHLRKKGKFYGWSASYNSNGQLVLGFLNPVKITTAKNSYGYTLENTVIMLDPGHGGKGDSGATGYAQNKNQYECALNLILANKVKNILEDLGATVIMTRTSDVNVTLDQRNSLARQYKPDIFISFHRNGSTSKTRCGYSTYYYNPFSMQLAKEIATKCDALRSCGTQLLNYSPPMQVCRISECPSILTENWFVTNKEDFNLIITDDFNNKNAEATVKGIIEYFKYIQ